MSYLLIGILYLISVLCYGWSAYITINTDWNKQLTYLIYAWGLVNVANISWFVIVRMIDTTKNLYVAGVLFDMLLSLAFIIPPLFLNQQLGNNITPQFVLGIALVLIGLFCIKLS